MAVQPVPEPEREDGGRERDEAGRFTGGRGSDPLDTATVVYEVALLACQPGHDPRRVTQRAWNRAKESSEWAEAPSADECCRQLKDGEGKPARWRELLKSVFEARDLRKTVAARRRAEREEEVLEGRIRYSLRRVVAFLGVETIASPIDYQAGCEGLLAREERRWKKGNADRLRKRLLTSNQILSACGDDWLKAVALAELPAPPPPNERRRDAPAQPVTEVRLVRALIEFDEHCRHSRSKRRSQKNYRIVLRSHPDWPALSRITERGNFDELLQKALEPGALERAEVIDLARAAERDSVKREPSGRPERRKIRTQAPDEERSQQILALLRKRSPQKARALYEKLGMGQAQFSRRIQGLIEAGLAVAEGETHKRVYWAAERKAKADAAASSSGDRAS